jgi:hypothetical protein
MDDDDRKPGYLGRASRTVVASILERNKNQPKLWCVVKYNKEEAPAAILNAVNIEKDKGGLIQHVIEKSYYEISRETRD